MLIRAEKQKVRAAAKQDSPLCAKEWIESFDAIFNNEECMTQVVQAAEATGHDVEWLEEPFCWAENFGAISASANGAMFAFGAGENSPQTHKSDYDFPDQLIANGKSIFFEI